MKLQDIGRSLCFALIVDFILIGNVVVVGCEVDFRSEAPSLFDLLHTAFVVFYILELLLRLQAYGKEFFLQALNWFDLLIVTLAVVDVAQTGGNTWLWRFTLFRAVRVLRVWKVAKFSKPFIDLWLVLVGLARASRALLWLGITLTIVGYACGSAITGMLRSDGPTTPCTGGPGIYCLDIDEYFGSVSRSMFTLFQLSTRSSWASHVVRPLALTSPLAALMCMFFVMATSYGLMSVAVGVLVYSTVELARNHQGHGLHRAETEDKEVVSDLANYFRASLAIEERTKMDRRELEDAMSVPQVASAFKHLELPVADIHELFKHLDKDKSGLITVEAFETGVNQMKMPAKRFDVACLTATVGGQVTFVHRLEERCDDLCGELEGLAATLNSAFADLSQLVRPDCDSGQVPEVILRKAGRIRNCAQPAPPRFTM